jgi:hypothetical protein
VKVDQVADQIEGAQIVSLDCDEETEVFTLHLSNGVCLYLVGGLGISLSKAEKLH